jgi:hypothetical protein
MAESQKAVVVDVPVVAIVGQHVNYLQVAHPLEH